MTRFSQGSDLDRPPIDETTRPPPSRAARHQHHEIHLLPEHFGAAEGIWHLERRSATR
jgi:hypothetical protein